MKRLFKSIFECIYLAFSCIKLALLLEVRYKCEKAIEKMQRDNIKREFKKKLAEAERK